MFGFWDLRKYSKFCLVMGAYCFCIHLLLLSSSVICFSTMIGVKFAVSIFIPYVFLFSDCKKSFAKPGNLYLSLNFG